MFAATTTLPPPIQTDEKRHSLHLKAVNSVREAQGIYQVPSHDIQKIAITAYIQQYLFEELPKTFDSIVIALKSEMQKNEPFDSESYRESRILYDAVRPFFDKIGKIEMPTTDLDEKELKLFKSLVAFLSTVKDHIAFLDTRFSELDKPKFKSRFFTHIPESELWARRNKNRPYLL